MALLQELDTGTPIRTGEATVTLTIDGRQVSVPPGTSVMAAAALIDNPIPKLCATDSVEAFGSCRLCLIEIEGRKGTPASCTTPAEAGMIVRTKTPRLERLRRGVMELYISDHPLDCLTCSANNDCELQAQAGNVGLRDVRYGYDGANHLKAPTDASNPYFTFESSKCIVCSRCVRACEEVQGTFALTILGRGFDSKVGTGGVDFLSSECVSCGACVQACPTATLNEKLVIEKGTPERTVVTTCAYCGVGCSFKAELKGDEVLRMVPYKAGKANEGHSCVKGRFAYGYATHKDRVLKPMIRERIEDPWREVSWDDAIAYAANEFRRIQAKYGRDSVGAISSSRCTNEEVFLVQKMVRAGFGNNNIDTCARVCHSPTGFGLSKTFGTSAGTQDFKSVEKTDVVVVIGANPTDAHPVFGSRMKKRLRAGARLIVIDPRRTDLVKSTHIKADYHLALKPGTNVAVLNALAHVIVTEGLVNEAFVRDRCDLANFESWARFVADPRHSPEATAEASGVDPGELRAAARLYATGGNGAIYYGLGVTEHSQGSTSVMAIANLAMATGNIGREGVGVNPLRGQNNVQGSCDMGSFPHEFSGYRHVSTDAVRETFERLWGVPLSNEPGLRIPNMIDEAIDGSFKWLYVQGEDIAQSDPDTKHITAGLRAMECVVVQDLFLNETARYAHVFLPGLVVSGKGRHVHQCRAPHQPRAQSDSSSCRNGRLGSDDGARQRDRRADELYPSERDHGRGRGHDADLQGRVLRTSGRTRLDPVAMQRRGADRHAGHARRPLRARQGPVHADRICRHRGARRTALPASADDRPHPVAIQCRRSDAPHRERRVAQRGRARNSSFRRRTARRARWRSRGAEEPERRDFAARQDNRARAAGDRLHDLPPCGDRRERGHHRLFGLGDQLP